MDPSDEKLLAEAEKLRAEAKDVGRSPFSRPSTWVPLFIAIGTAIGGLLTAYYQWQVKQVEVSEAKEQADSDKRKAEEDALKFEQQAFDAKQDSAALKAANDKLQGDVDGLSAQLADKRDQIQQANDRLTLIDDQIAKAQEKLAASPSADSAQQAAVKEALTAVADSAGGLARTLNRGQATVYVQFNGTITRDTIRGLQTTLQNGGYTVPGSEHVATTNFATEVRYFHPEDAGAAQDVAAAVADFLKTTCNVARDVAAKPLSQKAKLGNVEVWINESC